MHPERDSLPVIVSKSIRNLRLKNGEQPTGVVTNSVHPSMLLNVTCATPKEISLNPFETGNAERDILIKVAELLSKIPASFDRLFKRKILLLSPSHNLEDIQKITPPSYQLIALGTPEQRLAWEQDIAHYAANSPNRMGEESKFQKIRDDKIRVLLREEASSLIIYISGSYWGRLTSERFPEHLQYRWDIAPAANLEEVMHARIQNFLDQQPAILAANSEKIKHSIDEIFKGFHQKGISIGIPLSSVYGCFNLAVPLSSEQTATLTLYNMTSSSSSFYLYTILCSSENDPIIEKMLTAFPDECIFSMEDRDKPTLIWSHNYESLPREDRKVIPSIIIEDAINLAERIKQTLLK